MYWLSIKFLFCKQKTAYEVRISDWSSDVCSSDLREVERRRAARRGADRDLRREAERERRRHHCRDREPPVSELAGIIAEGRNRVAGALPRHDSPAPPVRRVENGSLQLVARQRVGHVLRLFCDQQPLTSTVTPL